MARTAVKSKDDVKSLKAENRKLRAQNKALQQTKTGQKSSSRRLWQKLSIVVCVSLAGAMLVTGNILFWTGNSVVNNDHYAAIVEPLIKEPAVQTAVASYTTKQIYANVDVEQKLTDSLPDQAKFLAPIVAPQIQSITQTTLLKVLQNPSFQDTWNKAQVGAHDRVLQFVKNYKGDGTIDLSDIYKQLSNRLSDTKLGFLANRTLPDKVGSITVVNSIWLPVAHNIVTNLALYQTLATLAVICLTAAAIWLAKNRRRIVIQIGLLYAVLMFISLVSFKVVLAAAANRVAPEYQEAARVVGGHLTHALVLQTRTILLLGLLMSFVAWIGGPSKVANAVRGKIQAALGGHLHKALFHKENSFTTWVGRYKRPLQWIAIALIALVMLAVQLSPALVIAYAIGMLLSVLVVELLAAS